MDVCCRLHATTWQSRLFTGCYSHLLPLWPADTCVLVPARLDLLPAEITSVMVPVLEHYSNTCTCAAALCRSQVAKILAFDMYLQWARSPCFAPRMQRHQGLAQLLLLCLEPSQPRLQVSVSPRAGPCHSVAAKAAVG